ncbi:FAM69C-like [Brachionus plicatilis]|uniref:FAM69C-like n=1 Tax=Brachionus plicatilis TaxID=10195 RepID=A0A3M7Q5G0_BRAPC|nr:FAM69C-like [Brachionus plicatilis]
MWTRILFWNLKNKKKFLLTCIFCLTVILYATNFYSTSSLIQNTHYKTKCDLDYAKHLIIDMCSLYEQESSSIMGNLCPHLCDKANSYGYYQNYRMSDCNVKGHLSENTFDLSKSVLIYELYKDKDKIPEIPNKLVLKSTKQYYLDFDTHLDFDFKDKPILEQLKYLKMYIDSTLQTKFGIKLDPNELKAWSYEYEKDKKSAIEFLKNDMALKRTYDFNYYVKLFASDNFHFYLEALQSEDKRKMSNFIQNLMTLTSQDEYLFYTFYRSKPGAIKIYGSCGHFYMVEFAHPLTYRVRLMDLTERKKLALQFLDLVHNLDSTYLLKKVNMTLKSEPVQMCDVKLDNFGLNYEGKLRIIDTDMASPDSYLFSEKICDRNEDCHFFDCKSYCSPETKKCIGKRVNNNLQAVCEKIFDNDLNKLDGILTGIQFESNTHDEIMNKLKICKKPGTYKNSDIPDMTDHRISRTLANLLLDEGIKLGIKQ